MMLWVCQVYNRGLVAMALFLWAGMLIVYPEAYE